MTDRTYAWSLWALRASKIRRPTREDYEEGEYPPNRFLSWGYVLQRGLKLKIERFILLTFPLPFYIFQQDEFTRSMIIGPAVFVVLAAWPAGKKIESERFIVLLYQASRREGTKLFYIHCHFGVAICWEVKEKVPYHGRQNHPTP